MGMSQSETPEQPRYLGLTPMQLNLAFFAVVGAIGLAVFAYLGGLAMVGDTLGGGNEPTDSAGMAALTPTPGAPSTIADPNAVAQTAVLTLADMPSGWTVDAPDDDDSDDDFEFTGECAVLNEEDFPGELASAESPDFKGPDNQQISSTASVFADEAAAQEALDTFDSVFSKCGDQFVAAFTEGLRGEGEDRGLDTTDVDVSLQKLSFAQLGDATIAHRLTGSMTMEGVPLEFTLDFVVVRAGRMAGAVTYMDFFGVNSVEEEALAGIAAGKLAEANASLGG